MPLAVRVAEQVLTSRFREPAKVPTQYVIGFKTALGHVLALHREANETRIWFEPPVPPEIAGVTLMALSAKNDNLNGPLASLNTPSALRVEIDSEAALTRFLDWYVPRGPLQKKAAGNARRSDEAAFRSAFARFQRLVVAYDKGNPFTNFQEGMIAVWEGYKPRLREQALRILGADAWTEGEIGSGKILQRTIDAVEIQDTRGDQTNNLVSWQNRWGHANRDHRALLEAVSVPKLRTELERLLFDLYRGQSSEGATFMRLGELTGAKYPLLAYLYFLKDMDRFMPIQPTGFDRAFRELNVDFVTLRNCSWSNYTRFNEILVEVRAALEATVELRNIRLIDAHSFCWVLATLLKKEQEGALTVGRAGGDAGRILGARERSIADMKYSIIQTVQQSRGQIVERVVQMKLKNLGFDEHALDAHIRHLLDVQKERCALTGIPFQFKGEDADSNLLPSPDRIDSHGHYEPGNIQIVCRFVNFWKSATPNDQFVSLLRLVRGLED